MLAWKTAERHGWHGSIDEHRGIVALILLIEAFANGALACWLATKTLHPDDPLSAIQHSPESPQCAPSFVARMHIRACQSYLRAQSCPACSSRAVVSSSVRCCSSVAQTHRAAR